MVAGVVVVIALGGFVVATRLRQRSHGQPEPSALGPADDDGYQSEEPERVEPRRVAASPVQEPPVRDDLAPLVVPPREEVSPARTVDPIRGDGDVRIREPIVPSTGLTYVDARSMVLDVFNANYLKMSREATAIARTRAESFTNAFLERLEETNPHALDSARDPDMQRAIFTAQLEFASSGDADLGELLVALLVDRARESKRIADADRPERGVVRLFKTDARPVRRALPHLPGALHPADESPEPGAPPHLHRQFLGAVRPDRQPWPPQFPTPSVHGLRLAVRDHRGDRKLVGVPLPLALLPRL
ncbi:MAG: hypothetical protein O3B84_03165 [Chloroflexi bacterium]|nr:hypothetical protein [Chloroflexota bacterium]